MSMSGDYVIRNVQHMMWDGTNGAAIAAMCDESQVDNSTWSVLSEDPGVSLVLRQQQSPTVGGNWTIPASKPHVLMAVDWSGVLAILNDDEFEAQWRTWQHLEEELIEDLPPGPQGPAGYLAAKTVSLPAVTLLAAGTRTLTVTWPRTLPNDTYTVDICPDGTLFIGTPYTFSITAKTTTQCTLNYTNSTLLTLGAGTIDLFAFQA